MPALQQVNNSLRYWWQAQSPSDQCLHYNKSTSLRHWWQAQSPSGQCPHYNKSTTVSDTDDKHSPRPTNARTTTSQPQSQTLMTSTVPVRPMPALQQVNNSLRYCLVYILDSYLIHPDLSPAFLVQRERERERENLIKINRKHDDTCTNKIYNVDWSKETCVKTLEIASTQATLMSIIIFEFNNYNSSSNNLAILAVRKNRDI